MWSIVLDVMLQSCESLGGAGAGAGDDVSVSSAELLGVTLRSDIPKVSCI